MTSVPYRNVYLTTDEQQRVERFFREYLKDETFVLPRVRICAGKAANVITRLIDVDGITFGRFVLVRRRAIDKAVGENQTCYMAAELFVHETMHTIQYARQGFIQFLAGYLREYFGWLWRKKKLDRPTRQAAYLNIAAEREAREAADRFCLWCIKDKAASHPLEVRLR